MRLFAVLIAVCALSSPAIAQTPNCKADVDGLLSCYDAPAAGSMATKPAAPASARAPAAKSDIKGDIKSDTKAGRDNYVDPITAEEARLNAQMKTICRGC
jgi:hypothetical protein